MKTLATNTSTGIPAIADSLYNFYLAGLGTLNVAGEEGTRFFQHLVEKGTETQAANMTRFNELYEKIDGLQADAKISLQRVVTPIEKTIEGTVHSGLMKLGVPTRQEILALTHKVEDLTKVVSKTKSA